MELPLISVIVPIYKVEAYLDRCVQSIVDQTYRNLEIILVDDGSPDNCPAMCDAWAERDSRIRVIHKENGGLSDARNAGMVIASGELMGFVDSDDWISPDMYRLLYENMLEHGSDISACGVEMVWEDGTPSRMLARAGNTVLNAEEAMLAVIEESWLKQPVWYKLYKTALTQEIAFPVGKYHEDVFWTYQAVGKAKRVSVFDTPCYFYTQRASSIMGEGYSLKRLDALEAKLQRVRYMEDKFPEITGKAKYSLWSSCIYSGQMLLQFNDAEIVKNGFELIKRTLSECPIQPSWKVIHNVKQFIWLTIAGLSLMVTCKLRNVWSIGF